MYASVTRRSRRAANASQRGLGATCNPPGSAWGDPSWTWAGALNPLCLFQPASTAAGEGIADVYQSVEYGSIPAPATAAGGPIVGMTQAETQSNVVDLQQQIQTAIDNGSYTPGGTLPVNASGDINLASSAEWGLGLIAIAVAAFFVLSAVLKR